MSLSRCSMKSMVKKMSEGWDEVPEGKALVSQKNNSPSSNAVYHTRVCYAVRDHYIARPLEWAKRARIEECEVCQKGNPSTWARGDEYESVARDIREENNS